MPSMVSRAFWPARVEIGAPRPSPVAVKSLLVPVVRLDSTSLPLPTLMAKTPSCELELIAAAAASMSPLGSMLTLTPPIVIVLAVGCGVHTNVCCAAAASCVTLTL